MGLSRHSFAKSERDESVCGISTKVEIISRVGFTTRPTRIPAKFQKQECPARAAGSAPTNHHACSYQERARQILAANRRAAPVDKNLCPSRRWQNHWPPHNSRFPRPHGL